MLSASSYDKGLLRFEFVIDLASSPECSIKEMGTFAIGYACHGSCVEAKYPICVSKSRCDRFLDDSVVTTPGVLQK